MTFVAVENNLDGVTADILVVINKGQLLCKKDSPWEPLPVALGDLLCDGAHQHYIGVLDGKHCFAVFYNEGESLRLSGYEWQNLRSQLGLISRELFQLAGRALQITRWYREHQYCGVCGATTEESSLDRALVCSACEHRLYPRISPCVIGLVKRGRECLLAQGVRHPEGLYSTLAGFVEPGESAEAAFEREVKEETNIAIKDVTYFGSQPWPFPGQLMLGYTAEYDSGEIMIDKNEIVAAAWFDVDDLPTTPPATTIAGQIIRQFVTSHSDTVQG